ncbi:37070_t:CDS:2, partial [Racocetra persica]
ALSGLVIGMTPIAYIKVVAVKKLVVEFRGSTDGGPVLLVSESPLTSAKAFAKDVFINQERKLGDRRRSDTVSIAIIALQRGIPSKHESSAHADYVPALCTYRPSLLPIEWLSETLGSTHRNLH